METKDVRIETANPDRSGQVPRIRRDRRLEISEEEKMDFKAGNRVFDPLTDVRGLDYKKRNLDSCLRRNDHRATIRYVLYYTYRLQGFALATPMVIGTT